MYAESAPGTFRCRRERAATIPGATSKVFPTTELDLRSHGCDTAVSRTADEPVNELTE